MKAEVIDKSFEIVEKASNDPVEMLATSIMETLRRLVDLRAFFCDAPVSKDLGAHISAFRDASNLRFTEDV